VTRAGRSAAELKATVRRVDKPWGHELIWADTELYVGKILHIEAGEALSLQYHRLKDETMFVLAGRIRVQAGPAAEDLEDMELGPGEAIRLTPGTVHRVVALVDSDVLEASTPHLQDLVRLEDRYGRGAGS
jgi:mannose-6-phosphate isomerase-like protein (cupin superfamily)